jgi:tripartite-type tricarboxylate transporter receptor subunit TctC
MNDLLGKQIDIMCDQVTNTTPYIQSQKVKAYAATSLQRLPALPALPTLDESGLKGFHVGIWHAMWVPKGTPKPVIDKLVAALQSAVRDPAFQKRMTTLGATPLPDQANPKALDQQVRGQVKQWGDLFHRVGVTPQ